MKKGYLAVILCLISNLGFAKVTTSAIYSPNCKAEELLAIAPKAIDKISEKQTWGQNKQGYIIHLDTNKMAYETLIRKMRRHGCFNKQ